MSELEGPELDVSECTFTVKDADGSIILATSDYKRAFQVKQFNPGSKVFVEAKVDVTIESFDVLKEVMGNEESD